MSRDEWEVGDKAQREDFNEETKVTTFVSGEVTAIRMDKREKPSYNYWNRANVNKTYEEYMAGVTVKWEDGTEEELAPYNLTPEDNEFEREFRQTIGAAQVRIREKLDLAEKSLQEAVDISEETGVAFSTGISFLSQSYVPASFQSKHPEVDRELMNSLCDVYYEYEGWQHSAVC